MAEYYFALTDINNAIDRLIHACPTTFYNGLQAARNIFSKDLAADVQPVRHGRWETPNAETTLCTCSVCGKVAPYDVEADTIMYWPALNYCPNCGAKMDGEA